MSENRRGTGDLDDLGDLGDLVIPELARNNEAGRRGN
jgi:hypothetical protein